MMKGITYGCMGLLLLGLAACRDEAPDSPRKTGERQLSVALSIPGSKDKGYVDYAMPADESRIEHIAVLVFKTDPAHPADVGKGSFLYRAGVSYNSPDPASCVIRVREMSDAQTFVVLANAASIVDRTPIAEGESKAYVIEKLLMNRTTAFDPAAMTSIPMWGEMQNRLIHDSIAPTDPECKLYRMLAKINVTVSTAIPDTDFELRSVRLYMPRRAGTLIPNNWGNYSGSLPGEPAEATGIATEPAATGTIPERAACYTYPTTTGTVENIYAFEARNAGSPVVDVLDRTCLVVGGRYKNDDSKEYYYRVDFKTEADQLDILRNFIYNITISSVGGMGVENPDAAYEGLSVIEAQVEPWNRATGEVQIWDPEHLYVSNRYPSVMPDGKTEHYEGSKTLRIKTTDPAGWQWKKDDGTQKTLTQFGVVTAGGAANIETSVVWNPEQGPEEGREGDAVVVSGNQEYTVRFIQRDLP